MPPHSNSLLLLKSYHHFLYHLLHASPNKQGDLDSISTLLKQMFATILPIITTMVNLSLSTGTFPIHFKHSLLTHSSKNHSSINNYRPISNLSLISKITECTVKSRLNEHLSSNCLCNPNQFANIKHHSIETTLLPLHDHLITAINDQ